MAADISSLVVGASSFIARVCKDLRIADTINRIVEWDEKQCKVSPGTRIASLVVNMLVERQPLYRVSEFYESMDLPVLFQEEGLVASDLNDDALGRALDSLYEAGPKHCFQSVACGAVSRGYLQVKSVHADTTSVSLWGEYELTKGDRQFIEANPDRSLINITHGYSKQHRPDLKQFVYGLVVSAEGVPLLGDANDGNTNDKTWNQCTIEEIKTSILDPQSIIYIADSALVTNDNLDAMAQCKMRFISRLPETYKVAAELKERAWSRKAWKELGAFRTAKDAAHYATQSFEAELGGRTYRFVVVRSSALDKRKEKAIAHRLEQERNQLDAEAKELAQQVFQCRPDAEQAMKRFLIDHKNVIHRLHGEVTEVNAVVRPKGRPRKDVEYPTVTTYTVNIAVQAPDPDKLKDIQERESTFVLITTLNEDDWTDAEILTEYKEQGAVERRFRFLKQPLLIDGIYLKSTRRAEALAHVFLLALFVAAFIEMKIRKELKRTKQQLEVPGKRLTDRPTIQSILDLLANIQVLKVDTGADVVRILPKNTDKRALQVLKLAGYDASIYTER